MGHQSARGSPGSTVRDSGLTGSSPRPSQGRLSPRTSWDSDGIVDPVWKRGSTPNVTTHQPGDRRVGASTRIDRLSNDCPPPARERHVCRACSPGRTDLDTSVRSNRPLCGHPRTRESLPADELRTLHSGGGDRRSRTEESANVPDNIVVDTSVNRGKRRRVLGQTGGRRRAETPTKAVKKPLNNGTMIGR